MKRALKKVEKQSNAIVPSRQREGVQPADIRVKAGGTKPSAAWKRPLPLALAGRFPAKVRGLLCSQPSEETLLIMPCCDVHTAGMHHHLDIAFVDAAGLVVESYRDVGPFRRLRKRGAIAVMERFASCSTPWFMAGDRVGVVRIEGEKL